MSLQQRLQSNTGDAAGAQPSRAQIRDDAERAPTTDPFADLKTRVHHDVITRLGPRLFAGSADEKDGELTERVLESVEEAIALDKTPLTRQERAQVAREIADDILGYGPLEPFLRDETVTEIMVNGAQHDLHRAARQADEDRGPLRRRSAPAAHHRQDHQPHRPAHRRGIPDGRCAPARRLARERDHPAARGQRPDTHDS